MAALRNIMIGLMRGAGYTTIAATCPRCASQPAFAPALLSIAREHCMALLPNPLLDEPDKPCMVVLAYD